MESNNSNIEIILNCLETTKESNNGEIITPNLDNSNSTILGTISQLIEEWFFSEL